jgi:hypothetical protein
MKKEKTSLEELKQLITEELVDCNSELWPKVCELQTTEIGRAKLDEMIIRYVAEEGMSIGSAIALIEQELAHSEQ